MCIRSAADIRNDREDASTCAFRKAGYRQFIIAKYGRLGKGRVSSDIVAQKNSKIGILGLKR